MKKVNILASALVLLLAVVFVSSCKKDDDTTTETPAVVKPILGTNFNYTVADNIVSFTTTMTGNVWWTSNGTDYAAVDQKAEVVYAEAGTYSFTCSVLSNGKTETSEAFDVEVLVGDPSVFDTEYWINLTGGYGQSKAWVLDVEAKVHTSPLSFLGTSWDFVEGACGDDLDCWNWDPDLAFTFDPDSANVRMDWPGTEGYGEMTFDLIDGKHFIADKKKEAAESGTYTLNWDTRTITTTGATILRSYKPFAQVKDDPNCEGDDCPTHLEDGIVGISDWNNIKIYALTDSVLRVAVSRDQDVHGEGVAWLIYNFVSKDVYESIIITPPPTYYEPINTDFTASDLVGIWTVGDIAQDWIGWPETGSEGGTRLNSWTNRTEMTETLVGWGASDAQEVFDAADLKIYSFNDDGTCDLGGVANTYSVTDGVITFGTELSEEFSLVWISLPGTVVNVLDVQFDNAGNAYPTDGIWLGQQNDGKNESKSVHLIKR